MFAPHTEASIFVGVVPNDPKAGSVRGYRKLLAEVEVGLKLWGIETLFATVDSRKNKRWTEFFGFRELTPGLMVKDI